jgi:hypothetical protein
MNIAERKAQKLGRYYYLTTRKAELAAELERVTSEADQTLGAYRILCDLEREQSAEASQRTDNTGEEDKP